MAEPCGVVWLCSVVCGVELVVGVTPGFVHVVSVIFVVFVLYNGGNGM
jgi:hypothetical protein